MSPRSSPMRGPALTYAASTVQRREGVSQPHARTCCEWNVPFLPVMPWHMTFVCLFTNTAGSVACQCVHPRQLRALNEARALNARVRGCEERHAVPRRRRKCRQEVCGPPPGSSSCARWTRPPTPLHAGGPCGGVKLIKIQDMDSHLSSVHHHVLRQITMIPAPGEGGGGMPNTGGRRVPKM